ncbi:hypothetical protein P879_09207 [Paragonimus westermani]|uniref:RRP15-like protein n=1 Tax=Paragonimus westermani TaxID=34504 RepID=A0A8T0DF02_9TREM|nr:hypothetical protein P879_09207 [Paragonimus westermani]
MMNYGILADVVQKILAESIPLGKHPILALAKTDRQKQQARELRLQETESSTVEARTVSSAERRRWLREAHKVPLAAAGIKQKIFCSTNSLSEQRLGSKDEVEWEHARERRLRLQATRGVIALFNSVRQHQSVLATQLNNNDLLETQKERILTQVTTSDFLDRLSAGLPKQKCVQAISTPDATKPESSTDLSPHPVSQLRQKRTLRTTFGVRVKKKAKS